MWKNKMLRNRPLPLHGQVPKATQVLVWRRCQVVWPLTLATLRMECVMPTKDEDQQNMIEDATGNGTTKKTAFPIHDFLFGVWDHSADVVLTHVCSSFHSSNAVEMTVF